jgi:hypothetical protein
VSCTVALFGPSPAYPIIWERKLIPSSICTRDAAWNAARSAIVTNVASGTPWKSSSRSGREEMPATSGHIESSKLTWCSQTESMPGNRGGSVTWALSQ